jgi:hypothetical protein
MKRARSSTELNSREADQAAHQSKTKQDATSQLKSVYYFLLALLTVWGRGVHEQSVSCGVGECRSDKRENQNGWRSGIHAPNYALMRHVVQHNRCDCGPKRQPNA